MNSIRRITLGVIAGFTVVVAAWLPAIVKGAA